MLLLAAWGYLPWRCLCRGLVQMTRTTPFRRITLQFSHIRLTLGLTFMVILVSVAPGRGAHSR